MKYLSLCVAVFALGFSCSAAESSATPKQEAAIRHFVSAYFSEDEESLKTVTADTLLADMHTYFWIKKTIHPLSECPIHTWTGTLEIVSRKRETFLHTQALISTCEEDVFEVVVDKKRFKLGLDANDMIIMINDVDSDKKP